MSEKQAKIGEKQEIWQKPTKSDRKKTKMIEPA